MIFDLKRTKYHANHSQALNIGCSTQGGIASKSLPPFFCIMYFKASSRLNPAKGKMDSYYRLVESYRNEDDRVCHRTLLNVGFLNDVLTIDQLNQVRRRLVERTQAVVSCELCDCKDDEDPLVNEYVDHLWSRLVNEKRIDTGASPAKEKGKKGKKGKKDWETLDMNSLSHSDVREVGAEWLCYQAMEQLGLPAFLQRQGFGEKEIHLAQTQLISRAVYPSSELRTSRWIRDNSSVCELTGFPLKEMNKDRLYRMSKKLYGLHSDLEDYLSVKTNELFDLEDKIILYDLTNTYFEGRMSSSKIAKHGRSKEKRSDCKLIVLGLVVNPQGFIKHSRLLEGNVGDPSTLEATVDALRKSTSVSSRKAIVVMDAGIATDSNLQMLKDKGFDYLCVSRSSLKDYRQVEGSSIVCVQDRKKRKIQLEKVSTDTNDEYYLKIESSAKKAKEESMNALFQSRFEAGLNKIKAGLSKKGGIKREDKVCERIGRLKGKYPSIQRHYEISYQCATKTIRKRKTGESVEQRNVTSIEWKIKDKADINERSGIYFLRTSLQETEKILWETYNAIREVESTIRCLKSDLDLRPVYHKKDEASMAHLHLGLLAYQIVNTIRYQLKLKPRLSKDDADETIHWDWREILRVMNTQKVVTTTAQNKKDEIIIIRKCSEPNQKVKQIYDKLAYRYYPFKKKKFVVHKDDFQKSHLYVYQNVVT